MQYIVVRRTITITTQVKFDPELYPGSETAQDAAEYERNLELGEKVESFIESLQFEGIDFGETVTVEEVAE